MLDWIRYRARSAWRLRVGSLCVFLALGWPLMLPAFLALTPGYVEFQFNSLPALYWVWLPAAVLFALGVLLWLFPGLRQRRVPFWLAGLTAALVVAGSLRVSYEHGLDLMLRSLILGSRTMPALLHVLANETASSRVTSRSAAARNSALILGHRGVPRLTTALNDTDWSVQASAAGVLAQLGPEAASAETALVAVLQDPDARVRSAAADALLRVAPAARFNVPVLISILSGSESLTRVDAAIALGDLGPSASAAVPALSEALHDPYWALRVNAAEALGRIGAAAAIPALNEALNDAEPRVRSSAAAALERIGEQ